MEKSYLIAAQVNNYRFNYLTFEILTSGTITWFEEEADRPHCTLKYKINNNETWSSITSSYNGSSSVINVNAGDIVSFKNDNYSIQPFYNYKCHFGGTATFNLSGNIMSLAVNDLSFKTADTISNSTMFENLFKGCNVISIENLKLPAKKLSEYCYSGMFWNCTLLTAIPKNLLPATSFYYSSSGTNASHCYEGMFYGCTSLKTLPKNLLPALILDDNCYANMFYGCTSLETLPKLPALNLSQKCYYQMFFGCSKIKLSTTQNSEYKTEYRIPINGTGVDATNALANMFRSTGGTFTGTPDINTTYYTSNEVI